MRTKPFWEPENQTKCPDTGGNRVVMQVGDKVHAVSKIKRIKTELFGTITKKYVDSNKKQYIQIFVEKAKTASNINPENCLHDLPKRRWLFKTI